MCSPAKTCYKSLTNSFIRERKPLSLCPHFLTPLYYNTLYGEVLRSASKCWRSCKEWSPLFTCLQMFPSLPFMSFFSMISSFGGNMWQRDRHCLSQAISELQTKCSEWLLEAPDSFHWQAGGEDTSPFSWNCIYLKEMGWKPSSAPWNRLFIGNLANMPAYRGNARAVRSSLPRLHGSPGEGTNEDRWSLLLSCHLALDQVIHVTAMSAS